MRRTCQYKGADNTKFGQCYNHESVPLPPSFAVIFIRRETVQRYTLCIMSIDDSHTTWAASNTRSTFFICEVSPYCYNKTHGTKNCVMDMTSQLDFNFRMQSVKFRDFENSAEKKLRGVFKNGFQI